MKRQVLAVMMAMAMFSVSCGAQEKAKPEVVKPEAVKPEVATAEAAPGGTPKIHFDKIIYDFGTTSMVSKLEGVIVISNTGDAPLEKIKAQAHCGCTSAPLKTDKLAPGEKTELAFTLAINAMNRGPLTKQITVTSNDPNQPSVNLTLKTDIIPIYQFTPQSIVLGNLHVGSSTNVVIEISRTDGKPLGVTKVDGAGAFVHPKLVMTEGVTTAGTVHVEIKAEGAPRNFNDAVRIFGENAAQPLMTIPVAGRFVGDLALSVEALFWGVADAANWPGPRGKIATTRKIVVTANAANEKLELSNLSSSIPELQLSVKPLNEGKQYEIEATLDKLPKESTPGTIKFDTNLKSQPSVEIKVQINILKRG